MNDASFIIVDYFKNVIFPTFFHTLLICLFNRFYNCLNLFQIEDDLATYVGAGSKVKEMTAVNTVSTATSF
jgi:hypothetical protein